MHRFKDTLLLHGRRRNRRLPVGLKFDPARNNRPRLNVVDAIDKGIHRVSDNTIPRSGVKNSSSL